MLIVTLAVLFQSSFVWASKGNLTNLFGLYWEESVTHSDPEDVRKLNIQTMKDISNFVPVIDEKRSTWITKEQAESVRKLMKNHPVVGERSIEKYDPNGNFGFCFGRAIWAHLELLRRNVSKQSIKKVFVVGEMDDKESPLWDYHVATAVKGPDDVWWVIDTWVNKVMTVEEWYNEMNKMSTDDRLRLYVTEPNRIGPKEWKYNIDDGGLYTYNSYFEDMFRYFRDHPPRDHEKFYNIPLTYDMPRSCRKVIR